MERASSEAIGYLKVQARVTHGRRPSTLKAGFFPQPRPRALDDPSGTGLGSAWDCQAVGGFPLAPAALGEEGREPYGYFLGRG